MSDPCDKNSEKKVLLYLSSNIFRRPKFPETSFLDLMRALIPCVRSTVRRMRIEAANKRINKDLDVT